MRRYMFSPAPPRSFACLSVCLCARLIQKNACTAAQSAPHCTKYNSPPIDGQCTNHCITTWWSVALDKMLRVDRCRDMDELIDWIPFWWTQHNFCPLSYNVTVRLRHGRHCLYVCMYVRLSKIFCGGRHRETQPLPRHLRWGRDGKPFLHTAAP